MNATTNLSTRIGFAVVGVAAMVVAHAATAADGVTITRFDAASVQAAFTAGAPLVETSSYKVHASRRNGAGQAEVHIRDTDIFYVLAGSAEVVTGGRMTTSSDVGSGELRGDAIEGGNATRIGAGDVLVIPAGVPHWFRRVDAPVVYYVVKVTEPR